MNTEYIYEKNLTDDKQLIAKLIKKINDWSNNLPHHPYRDFGKKITVESLYYTPAYPAVLKTQLEQREKSKKFIPYDGRQIPERKFYELEDIKIWEWNLKHIDKYTQETYNFFATGSEHVEDCHRCNAKGWITCTQCQGDKQITCPSCNGAGRSSCSSCGGSGSQKCNICYGSGRVTQRCSNCGGSGRVLDSYNSSFEKNYYTNCNSCGGKGENSSTCSSCGGRGKNTCSRCHGSGKITCSKCSGKGRITCPKCKGSGKNICPTCLGKQRLLHYFNISQTLDTDKQEGVMLHNTISAKFPEFSDNWSDYQAQKVFSTRQKAITEEHLPQDTHLGPLFDKQLNKARSFCNDSQRILFQTMDIYRTDVWLLKYTFEARTFYIAFYGHNYDIISGSSPISEFSSQLVHKAYHNAKERSYVKAYRITKKSEEIGIYEQKNIVKNQLAKLREKIAQPYLLGGKVGGLFAGLILGFMSLSFYETINFVLPWVQFINRPSNFLHDLHPWAMAFFTSWMVYKSGLASGKIANKIFGVQSNAYVRLTLGIVVALLFSLITTVLIALINLTGITILVTFVAWLAYWILMVVLMIIGIIIGLIIWIFELIFGG